MEDAIRRSVERQFPELTGGYHLPRFARVVGVADAPASAGICDDFRPRYAVDLQLLDENDEPDPALPVLAGVPLPLPVALFNDYQNNQSAMIAALPGLRPGASINQGERITQVTLTGNQMAIRWKTQSAAA